MTFTPDNAKAACTEMRGKGEQINADSLSSIKDNLNKAVKAIEFHGQSVLGVAGDDPNGCYVALVQKFKAETGTEVVQLNLFFMGSIKDRLVYFYVIAPYENESSVTDLLAREKGYVAALKSANGL